CHGCNKKGNAVHFYAKVNDLDNRRDFPKILKGIANDFGLEFEEIQSRITETYKYTDEQGNLLFECCRKEPKSFIQRRPNGNGSYVYNLKDTRLVLYRLSEIIEAEEIIIVEGEKDADNVKALGFTGTTSPMGAKKWRSEYNDYFKGKNVVLIPDNDNEGREHMVQVGAALKGIAKSLKWIDLPGIPSKGDISDWIKNFRIKEEAAERLSIMIESAKLYEPPKAYTLEDVILNTSDYHRVNLPEKKIIIHPIVSEQQIILISGWRGIGKSWFAIGLTDAVTSGKTFGPWNINNAVPCLYLDGEMAAQDVRKRIHDLNPTESRKAPLYVYSDAYANYLGLPRANLLSEKWRSDMKRILITRHVKLWVIDNIASLSGGIDENSKKDWDVVNQWLLDLRFAGITSILLHHTNKEGGQRGTSAREDNIDLSAILKRPPNYEPEDGADFIISFTKSRVIYEDLPLIQDVRFTLRKDDTGKVSWIAGNVKAEIRSSVLDMLNDGISGNEIAEVLSITKGYVSRIKKDAIEKGIMNRQGRYTE
ncbi:MAG: AAA family ATPase, partial [Bacteroidia bacterium]|nr:AAA family ATPase [Bacteroidia bacterium]